MKNYLKIYGKGNGKIIDTGLWITSRNYGERRGRVGRKKCGKRGRGNTIRSKIGSNGENVNGSYRKTYVHGKMNLKWERQPKGIMLDQDGLRNQGLGDNGYYIRQYGLARNTLIQMMSMVFLLITLLELQLFQ